MTVFFKFLKDKSLLTALYIIITCELLMQFGCYKSFLRKHSYAQNVNHITETAITSLNSLNPNVLIVGTSIAYEGISVERLNRALDKKGFIVQNIGIPGSELIIQDLAFRKILSNKNQINYIIHVNELHLPWVNRKKIIDSSLSMLGEFDRNVSVKRLREDEYDVSWKDYSSIFIKWISYRKDIGDLILKPDKRWKESRRFKKNNTESPFAYTNIYTQSLSHFQFNDLSDCKVKTSPGSLIPEGSDRHHLDAVHKTCSLVSDTKLSLDRNEDTELFKIRLKNFYSFIKGQNIKIINVYPPVSSYLDHKDHQTRKEFWDKEFADILSNMKLDLTDVIPEKNNSDYYYDVIHLNQKGMQIFTDSLAKSILELKI